MERRKISDLSNKAISSSHPSVESVEITFGLLFTSNAVWIWFAKILLHLQIYITLLFAPAAKAFKMSKSRYLESVWLSAVSGVTEEEEQNVEGHQYHVMKQGSRQETRSYLFDLKTKARYINDSQSEGPDLESGSLSFYRVTALEALKNVMI